MHGFAGVLPGPKQAGDAAFWEECSSCLETLLVPELPCARTPKRFNSRVCSPRVIQDSLKEVELKETPLISWSFYLHIWSLLLGTEEAEACYLEHEIIRRDIAAWRHCISQFLAQMLKSTASNDPFWVESPRNTTQSLPKPWPGFSHHGAVSMLASRRLVANLV